MKKRVLASILTGTLLLTGCASLLDRQFVSVTPHSAAPTTEGDPSILRASNYQELVNALLYFITQGVDHGTIRLYTDKKNIDNQLETACHEVVNEDPLGAYAVDFIKYSASPLMTCTEAEVQIGYRRSPEQIASIVSAVGTTAIRSELTSALAAFAPECVLRIGYFHGDTSYIRSLARQAFYDGPMTALDYPTVEVAIYPDAGLQRIVELSLSYHLDPKELQQRKEYLAQEVAKLGRSVPFGTDTTYICAAAKTLLERVSFDPQAGNTAWHALTDGRANSEGLALAFSCLCQQLHIPCHVVTGAIDQVPHFWNMVSTAQGWRHMDLSLGSMELLLDSQITERGYSWDTSSLPKCAPPSITP